MQNAKHEVANLQKTCSALNKHAKELDSSKLELTQHLQGAMKEIQRLTMENKTAVAGMVAAKADLAQANKLANDKIAMMEEKLGNNVQPMQEELLKKEQIIEQITMQKESFNKDVALRLQQYEKDLNTSKRNLQELNEKCTKMETQHNQEKIVLSKQLTQSQEASDDLNHAYQVKADELNQSNTMLATTLDDFKKLRMEYDRIQLLQTDLEQEKSVQEQALLDNTVIKDNLEHLGLRYLAINLAECDNPIEPIQEYIEELREKCSIAEDKSIQAEEELNSIESKLQSSEKAKLQHEELIEEQSGKLAQLKSEVAALVQTTQEMQQMNQVKNKATEESLQEAQRQFENDMNQALMDKLKFQRTAESLKCRVLALEDEKKDLLDEAERLNSEIAGIRQKFANAEVDFQNANTTKLETTQSLEQMTLENQQLEKRVQHLATAINALEMENDLKMKEIRQDADADHDAQVSELSECKIQISDMQTENLELSTALQAAMDSSTQLSEQLNQTQLKQSELESENTTLAKKVEKYETSEGLKLSTMQGDLEKLNHHCDRLQREKTEQEAAATELQHEFDNLQLQHQQQQNENLRIEQMLQDARNKTVNLQSDITTKQHTIDKTIRLKEQSQDDADRMTKEYNDMLRQFEVMRRNNRSDIAKLNSTIDELKAEMSATKRDLLEATSSADDLRGKLAMIQNATNGTVNELMEELKTMEEQVAIEQKRKAQDVQKHRNQINKLESASKAAMDQVDATRKSLEEEIADLNNSIQELQQVNRKLQSQSQNGRNERERLLQDVQVKESSLLDVNRSHQLLSNEKLTLEQKYLSLKASVESRTRQFEDTEDEYRSQLDAISRENRNLQVVVKRLEESAMDAPKNTELNQELMREKLALQSQVDRLNLDIAGNAKQISELTTKIKDTQEAANATISMLQKQLEPFMDSGIVSKSSNSRSLVNSARRPGLETGRSVVLDAIDSNRPESAISPSPTQVGPKVSISLYDDDEDPFFMGTRSNSIAMSSKMIQDVEHRFSQLNNQELDESGSSSIPKLEFSSLSSSMDFTEDSKRSMGHNDYQEQSNRGTGTKSKKTKKQKCTTKVNGKATPYQIDSSKQKLKKKSSKMHGLPKITS